MYTEETMEEMLQCLEFAQEEKWMEKKNSKTAHGIVTVKAGG